MIVKENDTVVLVAGKQFKYYLNKRTGLFSKLIFEGKDRIMQPMEVNIWRTPADENMYTKSEWYRVGYDKTSVRAYNTSVHKTEKMVIICSSMSLVADAAQRILDMQTVWTIDVDGVISLNVQVKRYPELPPLPRFEIRIHLAEEMNEDYVKKQEELTAKKHNDKPNESGLDQREFELKLKLVPYTRGE